MLSSELTTVFLVTSKDLFSLPTSAATQPLQSRRHYAIRDTHPAVRHYPLTRHFNSPYRETRAGSHDCTLALLHREKAESRAIAVSHRLRKIAEKSARVRVTFPSLSRFRSARACVALSFPRPPLARFDSAEIARFIAKFITEFIAEFTSTARASFRTGRVTRVEGIGL